MTITDIPPELREYLVDCGKREGLIEASNALIEAGHNAAALILLDMLHKEAIRG